jgi:hypothetical protein
MVLIFSRNLAPDLGQYTCETHFRMKRPPISESGYLRTRLLFAVLLCFFGALFAMLSFAANPVVETGSGGSPLAPTSGPGWSKVTAGDLSRGTFNAVTCTSSTQCWAVGSYPILTSNFGVDQTLIEQWNGTSWSIVSSPNSGDIENVLYGVTCTSASQCWAVGTYRINGQNNQTLIEQWNGTSWSVASSPNANSPAYNALHAVTCSSATQCWAVGEYQGTSGDFVELIEQWNGTSWSILSSPPTSASNLTAVTCLSASQCFAVGYTQGIDRFGSPFINATIQQWNGTSWTDALPFQSGTALYGVSCASTSQCWAVGGSSSGTLVYEWNGTSWAIVSSPNQGTVGNTLKSIYCISTSICHAVGSQSSGGFDQTLIERWNGTSWSVVSSPDSSSAVANDLNGVTCVPGVACWAVGSHENAINNATQTLVEELSTLGTWSIVASPNYIPPNMLNSVNCASAQNCLAVGEYNNGTSSSVLYQTVIEQWNGTSWTLAKSPNQVSTQATNNFLQGVTCVSASNCWAVGDYVLTNHYQTLTEHWDGTTWSIVSSPNTSTTQSNNLYSVACASASQCWSVGNYLDNALNTHPLAEQWDGSAWSIVTLPANNTSLSAFNGATCASSSECWVVGYYTAGSGFSAQYQTLVEQWNGTSWSIVNSANTSTSQPNFLNAVTCSSTSDCWSVGYYQNGSVYQTLTEHWNGSSWSLVGSPNVGTQSNYFTSVTCSSASDCWATGYNGASGSYQTLTEHWDGTSWSIVSSLNPGGSSHNNVFNGVACSLSSLCWALGDYNDGNIDQQLIEAYSPAIPPVTSVVSRLTHGSAGVFDITLPLTGTRGIECRNSAALGPGKYSVVFTFVNNIANCGSAGTTGGSVVSGPLANQCTENLTGVPNAQYTSVVLNSVIDGENNSGSVAVPMGVLAGDVNATARTDSGDVTQVRNHTVSIPDQTTLRFDVNASGRIDAGDVTATRNATVTVLP